MANFCTNCGAKVGMNDNFCTNCGAKIDNGPLLKSVQDNLEKKEAKKELERVVGGIFSGNKTFTETLNHYGLPYIETRNAIKQKVEKEIDSGEIKKGGVEFRVNQLIIEYNADMARQIAKENLIDRIFESDEIRLEITKNNIGPEDVSSIKTELKKKTKENSEEEIRDYIKIEFEKIRIAKIKEAEIAKEKQMRAKRMPEREINGGYCNFDCRHFFEEYLDSGGSIVGDFDDGGIVDYCCNLGHNVSIGSFCKDYKL